MSIISLQFFAFFGAVLILLFRVPQRWRWVVLTLSSYYFYMCWRPYYAILLLLITAVTYLAGRLIEAAETAALKKRRLIFGVTACLGILGIFKYLGFVMQNLRALANAISLSVDIPYLKILVPIGISFYTFQTIGYLIDVYRGKITAERHFGIYTAFISFFPQLLAGPIERGSNMLPQYHAGPGPRSDDVLSGIELAAWGIFKKIAVADLLAPVVTTVFAAPAQYSGPTLLMGTLFFSVQVYCDFSGYSDFAVGVARMMGYRLMINFKQPYFSRSIGKFWGRWHISLSSWFRDYVFFPLGGPYGKAARWIRNVLVTFALCGLWHGASWTFVGWGLLHGSYLVCSNLTRGIRASIVRNCRLKSVPLLYKWSRIVFVFGLVNIGWVLFRANSFSDAVYILTHFFDIRRFRVEELFLLGLPRYEMVSAGVLTAVMFIVDWVLSEHAKLADRWWKNNILRYCMDMVLAYAIVFFGVFGKIEFIYFQF